MASPQPVEPLAAGVPTKLAGPLPFGDASQYEERRGGEDGRAPTGTPTGPLQLPGTARQGTPKAVDAPVMALERQTAAASLTGAALGSGEQPTSLADYLAARPFQWQPAHHADHAATPSGGIKTQKFISPVEVFNGKGGTLAIKAAVLQGEQDTYYVSQTMGKGGFGKIRYALGKRDMRDKTDRRLAVKAVYLATKKDTLGTDVPMQTKVTHPRTLGREIEVLRHLGLLREVIKDGSKVHLVLDFAQGDAHELRVQLRVKDQAPLLRTVYAAHLLAELTRSLAAIHARGVAHRDVKLANFLYDATGKLTPTDFGLSVFTEDEAGTIPTSAGGTRVFMAPEVVWAGDDKSVVQTLGVDTWAAAMVTVQAWTGQSNPLAKCKDPQDMKDAVEALLDWRQQLVVRPSEPSDPNLPDTLNLQRIGTLGCEWDDYFTAMSRQAPALLDLLLTHMLQPDVARRVSMQRALELALALKAQLPEKTVTSLERVWGNAARRMSTQKKKVFDALEDFGEAMAAHRPVQG
jgi:serine/threonine protein kinase